MLAASRPQHHPDQRLPPGPPVSGTGDGVVRLGSPQRGEPQADEHGITGRARPGPAPPIPRRPASATRGHISPAPTAPCRSAAPRMRRHAHARVGQGRDREADQQAEQDQHGAAIRNCCGSGSSVRPGRPEGRSRLAARSCRSRCHGRTACRGSSNSRLRLSPSWRRDGSPCPRRRHIPVDGSTGRMKLIFISSDV